MLDPNLEQEQNTSNLFNKLLDEIIIYIISWLPEADQHQLSRTSKKMYTLVNKTVAAIQLSQTQNLSSNINSGSFALLPNELMIYLFQLLLPSDLFRLGMASKKLFQLTNDKILWQTIYCNYAVNFPNKINKNRHYSDDFTEKLCPDKLSDILKRPKEKRALYFTITKVISAVSKSMKLMDIKNFQNALLLVLRNIVKESTGSWVPSLIRNVIKSKTPQIDFLFKFGYLSILYAELNNKDISEEECTAYQTLFNHLYKQIEPEISMLKNSCERLRLKINLHQLMSQEDMKNDLLTNFKFLLFAIEVGNTNIINLLINKNYFLNNPDDYLFSLQLGAKHGYYRSIATLFMIDQEWLKILAEKFLTDEELKLLKEKENFPIKELKRIGKILLQKGDNFTLMSKESNVLHIAFTQNRINNNIIYLLLNTVYIALSAMPNNDARRNYLKKINSTNSSGHTPFFLLLCNKKIISAQFLINTIKIEKDKTLHYLSNPQRIPDYLDRKTMIQICRSNGPIEVLKLARKLSPNIFQKDHKIFFLFLQDAVTKKQKTELDKLIAHSEQILSIPNRHIKTLRDNNQLEYFLKIAENFIDKPATTSTTGFWNKKNNVDIIKAAKTALVKIVLSGTEDTSILMTYKNTLGKIENDEAKKILFLCEIVTNSNNKAEIYSLTG